MRRRRLLPALAAALLLALSACGDRPAPTAAPTASAAPATEAPSAAPATEAPSAVPTAAPTAAPTETPAPPEADTVLEVEMNGEVIAFPAYTFFAELAEEPHAGFSCILPVEAVAAAWEDNAWVFRCASDPEAARLELFFVAGGEAESLLPGILDGCLDFREIEFSSAASLGQTRGETGLVTASGEGGRAEARILDLPGGAAVSRLVVRGGEAEAALLEALRDTILLEN